MNKIKNLTMLAAVFIAACAWASFAAAETAGSKIARTAAGDLQYREVTLEKYPDADSVLVSAVEETRYKPDGSYVSDEENAIKILTEKGRREESVITLSYSARYGTAKLVDVAIVHPDGKRTKVDFLKTTKESTDNSSVSANIYDPMDRCLTCAVPGLSVGDVLVYSIRREVTRARVKNHFASISILEWSCPIVRSVVRIIAPRERPLKRTALRNPLGNVKYSKRELADGSTLHEWVAKDSPQAFSEPSMPPLYTQVQNLYISTANDWEEISKWYWNLCAPHLSKGTAEMTNCVSRIVSSVGEKASDIEKISAVYKWVAQEIRYMGLTMEETSPGYAPHDSDITFNNRYGVCRDKAALLAAMLRIAGYEAYPVLIHAGAKMDNEVPLPYFNHAITAVRAPDSASANKDGYILMDATDESSRDIMPAYLCDRSYLVATPFGEKLHVSPVPSADENVMAVRSDAVVERDGSMLVKSSLAFKGYNDNAYRGAFLSMKSDERRRMLERIVHSTFSGAELLSFEITPADLRKTEEPLSVNISYRINDAVVRGESCDELLVPFISRAMGAANWMLRGKTSLEQRRFPLRVSTTAKADEKVVIKFGGALGEPKFLPDDISVDGAYSFKRQFRAINGELAASRTLSINDVEFSPAEYEALLDDIKNIEAGERKNAFFGKNVASGSDVRYRECASVVNVAGPKEWVITNIVEKEILTYEGKKSSAELMFEYNPTWKSIEVVSAVVSNKNGTVVSVSPHEKTVLDSSWASAAPRYPASKRLIVNLPSVEIGSVVRYVTVTAVTNSPLPFYVSWNFDSTEPVDLMRVEYSDWTGEKYMRTERNLKVVPSEPMQAPSHLWRDVKTVSLGDFASAAEALRAVVDVKPEKLGALLAMGIKTEPSGPFKVQSIRNWMAKNVRIAGPSLYEMPLSFQMTDPSVVISERYGSRLDYIRTMCALMKGAGFDASVVFVSNDADKLPESIWRNLYTHPAVSVYSLPVCRVRVKEGSVMGFGGRVRDYYFGVENEYTPAGATVNGGSTFLDPADPAQLLAAASCSELERIAQPGGAEYDRKNVISYNLFIRENGGVDIDYEEKIYGASAGSIRRFYAEILPEDRARHFQGMLGGLAQAAVATRELKCDITGYPFTRSFSAFIPDYASCSGDMMSVEIPGVGARLFSISGNSRRTPIYMGGVTSESVVKVKIVFPKEYSEVEHLPESFDFGAGVRSLEVSREVDDEGRLVVIVVQRVLPAAARVYPVAEFARLKDYSRIASCRANRVVSVRRQKHQVR